MMQLFLEPVDVWLFRDGRSFDAGSDHRAESLFPPYPSVMQGVIRSHHLVVKGVDLRDKQAIINAVGTADDYGALRMRGPFVARRENGQLVRYLPQPADAYTVNKDTGELRPASPPEKWPDDIVSSVPATCLLGMRNEPKKAASGLWLDEQSLIEYLAGKTVKATRADRLFARESRYGIGRDDAKRTTQEGALYEVEFIRPCPDVGLYIEVDGYDGWPQKIGVLRIGGEGRGARFEQIEPAQVSAWPAPPSPLPKRFKVYFATPTYFEQGWQPNGWSRFFDGPVELAAAAIHRYESLGGFDWAHNAHKPARRYVPAGSVYYFECKGATRLAQNAITDSGAEIGFGQIIITEWKEK
jgi:CRISPR-associated protein Cmr3